MGSRMVPTEQGSSPPMKDLRAQIEKSMDAKLKAYGRVDKAEDKKMLAEHESTMHGVKHRAAGGAIDGMPARGRLDRKGGKGKKGDKSKTTVNVMVAAKEDKPPMVPPMMDKPPAPPMPPPAPPMPPAGAMPLPPPGVGPGGTPMMRAAGGRLKKRADGGEVVDDQAEYQVAGIGKRLGGLGNAAKFTPRVVPKPVPKPVPTPTPRSNFPHEGGAIGEAEAVLNGTPGAPIGTVRRGVIDALKGMGRKRDEKRPEDAAPKERASGGRIGMTAGAGSGEGRLEKIDAQKK